MIGVAPLLAAALNLASAAVPVVIAPPPTEANKTPASTQALDPQRIAIAREVMALSAPRPMLLASNVRGWETTIDKSLRADPGIARLEATYPGLIANAIAAAKPLAQEYSEKFVTQALDIRVQTFAEYLTVDEMQELIAFYKTPAGQRFIARLWTNLDATDLISDERILAARDSDAPLSLEDSRRATKNAAANTMKDMTAEDILEVMRFGQRPAAQAAASASREAEQRLLPIVNNPDPEWLKRQKEILERAMITFADQHRIKLPAKR